MQISRAKVTETGTCRRCRGNGFGDWRPMNGRCYDCTGKGIVGVAWEGQDVTAYGYVARPYALIHGMATFRSVLLITTTAPASKAFSLTIRTTLLDGTVHTWKTTDKAKADAAQFRLTQVPGGVREMTEAQVAEEMGAAA